MHTFSLLYAGEEEWLVYGLCVYTSFSMSPASDGNFLRFIYDSQLGLQP